MGRPPLGKKSVILAFLVLLSFFQCLVVSTQSIQFSSSYSLISASSSFTGEVVINGNNYYVLLGDMHMHTLYSDGRSSPIQMVEKSRELGYDFIAITDHGEIRGAIEAKGDVEKYGIHLIVIVGEEVTTDWGHLLALRISQVISQNMEPDETCKAIHDQGGYAVPAHPLWGWNESVFKSLMEGHQVDAYEAYNGNNNCTPNALSATPIAAQYPFVADSDAHNAVELGSATTIVFSVNRTVNGIFDAILNYRVVAKVSGQYVGNATLVNILKDSSKILEAKTAIGYAESTIVKAKMTKIPVKPGLSQAEGLLNDSLNYYWVKDYDGAIATAQRAKNIARIPIYIQNGVIIAVIAVSITMIAVVVRRKFRSRHALLKEAMAKIEVPPDLDSDKLVSNIVDYIREHRPTLYEIYSRPQYKRDLIHLTQLLYGIRVKKEGEYLKLLVMFATENNIPLPRKGSL